LPDKDKDWVDAKPVKVFGHPDPEAGLFLSRRFARGVEKSGALTM
jgi:putative transposase